MANLYLWHLNSCANSGEVHQGEGDSEEQCERVWLGALYYGVKLLRGETGWEVNLESTGAS